VAAGEKSVGTIITFIGEVYVRLAVNHTLKIIITRPKALPVIHDYGNLFLTGLNRKPLMQIPDHSSARTRRRLTYKKGRHEPRTDMTPMVDLGFLLIAFFVMTTELDKPAVIDLAMPTEKGRVELQLGESKALTILLGDNGRIFYYHGKWEDASRLNKIGETTLFKDGLRKIIRDKQAWLEKEKVDKEGRDGLTLMIKATEGADYKTIIDVLDETIINDVKIYMLIKPSSEEIQYLAAR
jgi:biopolymer transport protein ExbD